MLYGRWNGLWGGPKRAIYCLWEGWKWSWGPVGGKQGIHMSKKEWACKNEGKKWNQFWFLALQSTPHSPPLSRAKNSRKSAKRKEKCNMKKRELHEGILGAWLASFEHGRTHLISLIKFYTLIFSLSSMNIMLMLPPFVASLASTANSYKFSLQVQAPMMLWLWRSFCKKILCCILHKRWLSESLWHKKYICLSRGGRPLRFVPHCCVVSISFTCFVVLHSIVMSFMLQLLHNMQAK